MKKLLSAGCVLLLAAAATASDDPLRIWSQPPPPSREALDRLNLQLAWAVHVPMDGRRDGFSDIEIVGDQVLVQTRSGLVTLLDAENGGRALWRSRPGRAYEAVLPPAYNTRTIFTTDSGNIFALDRDTGSLQFTHSMSVALSAPLQVDDSRIFFSTVQRRTVAFRLPAVLNPTKAEPPPDAGKKPEEAAPAAALPPGAKAYAEDVRPLFDWDYQTNERIESRVIPGVNAVFLALPGGSYLALPKKPNTVEGNAELYQYRGDSPFAAPPGHAGDAAYLATEDAHVYAVGVDSGKVLWRYICGTPLTRAPMAVDVSDGAAVDKDLYVTAQGKGLGRLNRDTGEPLWNIRKQDYSPEAERILAVNPKFVYAADRVGRLLILDRKNGAQLTRYDVHDYVFPVVNATTDRIYLAANDGLIVCLHDKDYPLSLQYNKVVAPPAEKSLKERIQELTDKLAKPISEPEAPAAIPFKTFQETLSKKYGLKMFVSEKAFKDLMVPSPSDQMVTPAKVDNKPLGDALKDVLDTVGATYTQVEDTIVIGPKTKGP